MWTRRPTSTGWIDSDGSRVFRPERTAARSRGRPPARCGRGADVPDRCADAELLPVAESLTLAGFGETVTYSRKVFIPLTQLCRDVCHYCTFAKAPRHLKGRISHRRGGTRDSARGQGGRLQGSPLHARRQTRSALCRGPHGSGWRGAASTLDYLERMARLVLEETGLLPHLNPGVMDSADLRRLRPVSASMGLMLESASNRLCERGGPHFGSPDKVPAKRLATLRRRR